MFNTLNMSLVYHLKEGKNLRYLSHKRYRNVGHKHCFCVGFFYIFGGETIIIVNFKS